jgi:hypothetical protein
VNVLTVGSQSGAYLRRVGNGSGVTQTELSSHIPSHIYVAGNRVLKSCGGQPMTSSVCNGVNRVSQTCPRRMSEIPTEQRTTSLASAQVVEIGEIGPIHRTFLSPSNGPRTDRVNLVRTEQLVEQSHETWLGDTNAPSSPDFRCHFRPSKHKQGCLLRCISSRRCLWPIPQAKWAHGSRARGHPEIFLGGGGWPWAYVQFKFDFKNYVIKITL